MKHIDHMPIDERINDIAHSSRNENRQKKSRKFAFREPHQNDNQSDRDQATKRKEEGRISRKNPPHCPLV